MIRRFTKPWGEEILFARTDRYAGKVLRVRQGESLSLQYHQTKDESLYLHEGRINVILEVAGKRETKTLTAGEAMHFPPGTRHRIEALADSTLFEVSTPELEDVIRLEDRYGRA